MERLQQVYQQLDATPLLRAAISGYIAIFSKLHRRLSQHPIPALPSDYNITIIIQIIHDACNTISIACFIANSLIVYLHSRNTQMTGLRASPVYLFTSDEKSWPVIEWTESDETKNVAIFHFDEEQCSWIMHSVVNNGQNWDRSRVSWNVARVEHLKLLFRIAQHFFGVLQWSNEDVINIYCDRNFDNCPLPEFASMQGAVLTVDKSGETSQGII